MTEMGDEIFLPILKVDANKVNKKVIVCGDPSRAAKIADRLDEAQEVSYNREYRMFNGIKDGVELTVVSHGVGAAGAAVCFEELIKAGAEEIIRVGTAGSLKENIVDGDIVIATGAVREDGLTGQLVADSYPALADHRLIHHLEEAGKELEIKTGTGIVLTLAAFYPELNGIPNNYFSKANVIAVEMEASALFVIASLHGVSAGAILAIDGVAIDFDVDNYNPHRNLVDQAIEHSIDIAINALI
jgi:uridine phosphorylase